MQTDAERLRFLILMLLGIYAAIGLSYPHVRYWLRRPRAWLAQRRRRRAMAGQRRKGKG